MKKKKWSMVNDQWLIRSGFTLIELLVVVAIIGVLSALLMSNFIGVRQRARDAQRKSDIRQIQAALELYRADLGKYPVITSPLYLNSTACPTSSSLTAATGGGGGSSTIIYMKTIPCDPSGTNSWNNGNYLYRSTDGLTYTLAACLENTNDGDSHDFGPPSPGNSSTTYFCTTQFWFEVTNP